MKFIREPELWGHQYYRKVAICNKTEKTELLDSALLPTGKLCKTNNHYYLTSDDDGVIWLNWE